MGAKREASCAVTRHKVRGPKRKGSRRIDRLLFNGECDVWYGSQDDLEQQAVKKTFVEGGVD